MGRAHLSCLFRVGGRGTGRGTGRGNVRVGAMGRTQLVVCRGSVWLRDDQLRIGRQPRASNCDSHAWHIPPLHRQPRASTNPSHAWPIPPLHRQPRASIKPYVVQLCMVWTVFMLLVEIETICPSHST